MIVVWLFLTVPWFCLKFVIVIFPDHTHLIFFAVFAGGSCYIVSFLVLAILSLR